MTKAIRFDSATIRRDSIVESKYGFLTVEAAITRTGVMPYMRPDGTIVKEAKLPEEVFAEDTVNSAKGVPITDTHPFELVTTANYSTYMKGTTHVNARQEGDLIVVTETIFDQQLIEDILSGDKEQLSIGFEADIVEESGEFNGEEYDFVQRNMVINHVAHVPTGRAGSDVKARLDASPVENMAVMVATDKDLSLRWDSNEGEDSTFWEFRKDSAGDNAELLIYGVISDFAMWEEDVAPTQFYKDLNELGDVENITVRINSPGGSVFAGDTINSLLKSHPAHINVHIDGLAGSAASLIAMAGNTVSMPKHSKLMIHNPRVGVQGESKDLIKTAAILEKLKESAIAAYQEKTSLSNDKISKMMDDETWLTAQESYDLGFIDEVVNYDLSTGRGNIETKEDEDMSEEKETQEVEETPVEEVEDLEPQEEGATEEVVEEEVKEDAEDVVTLKAELKSLQEGSSDKTLVRLSKDLATKDAELKSLQGQLSTLQTKLDEKSALESDLAEKEEEVINLEAKLEATSSRLDSLEDVDIDQIISDRMALVKEGQSYVGDSIDASMSADEIKVAVIQMLNEDFDPTDRTEMEIDARFDATKEVLDKAGTSFTTKKRVPANKSKKSSSKIDDMKAKRLNLKD